MLLVFENVRFAYEISMDCLSHNETLDTKNMIYNMLEFQIPNTHGSLWIMSTVRPEGPYKAKWQVNTYLRGRLCDHIVSHV